MVHFDVKLLSSISSIEKVDRIAVKVTCGKVDQFIGNIITVRKANSMI